MRNFRLVIVQVCFGGLLFRGATKNQAIGFISQEKWEDITSILARSNPTKIQS